MPKNKIDGNKNDNVLRGTQSGDRILGRDGNDDLRGRDGKDILFGGDGRDTLNGGNGADELAGGGGNDRLIVSAGADALRGGGGRDTLDASTWDAGVWLNLASSTRTDFTPGYTDGFVPVEGLSMKLRTDGPNADWTVQQVANDFERFIGSDARDWVNLAFQSSYDTVDMGGGDDTFSGHSVNLVSGGRGNDRLGIDNGRIEGGRGNDRLTASAFDGDATLFGGRGNDSLQFGADATVRGGAGNDTLIFGNGSSDRDTFAYGGRGADTFQFLGAAGTGKMRDFKPGVDKIDLTGYSGTDPSINWETLQDMFERGDNGVRIRLDSDRYTNQLFEFEGLTRGQLSEGDFIL